MNLNRSRSTFNPDTISARLGAEIASGLGSSSRGWQKEKKRTRDKHVAGADIGDILRKERKYKKKKERKVVRQETRN